MFDEDQRSYRSCEVWRFEMLVLCKSELNALVKTPFKQSILFYWIANKRNIFLNIHFIFLMHSPRSLPAVVSVILEDMMNHLQNNICQLNL